MFKFLIKAYIFPVVLLVYVMSFTKPTNKLAFKLLCNGWFRIDVILLVQTLVYVSIYQSIM